MACGSVVWLHNSLCMPEGLSSEGALPDPVAALESNNFFLTTLVDAALFYGACRMGTGYRASVAKPDFWWIIFVRTMAAQQHLEALRASQARVRPERAALNELVRP